MLTGIRVLLAAALLLAGCVRRAPDAGPATHREPARITVVNNNWSDVTVYLSDGAARHRLGTVSTREVALFRLPPRLTNAGGDVRLIADPVGSSSYYYSDPFWAPAGARVEWTLENQVGLSSLVVR